jgi:hypothetical protein
MHPTCPPRIARLIETERYGSYHLVNEGGGAAAPSWCVACAGVQRL